MKSNISIYKDVRRKKPWVVRWKGNINPATGRQKFYSKAFRTKNEAEDFKAKKHREFVKGSPRDGQKNITLGSFLKEWIEYKKSECTLSSIDLYNLTIKRLKKHFGSTILIKDITAHHLALFISTQKRERITKKSHVELSAATRERFKRHCKTIFNNALIWGYIHTNPSIALKRKETAQQRWHRITVKEYQSLLQVAPTLRWQVFYALAYTSGARLSELFSLTWNDIDFEKGRLIIANREANNEMPPFKIKDFQNRRVPLPSDTIDYLTRYQTEAPEGVPYILLDSDRYDRVKTRWRSLRKKRKPWKNSYMVNNVLRDFKRHFKKAGIAPNGSLTIHTFRKSCGQNWADRLPINVVKEFMGHSSIATTQKYYSQVDAVHERMAAQAIQDMLEGSRKEVKSEESCA